MTTQPTTEILSRLLLEGSGPSSPKSGDVRRDAHDLIESLQAENERLTKLLEEAGEALEYMLRAWACEAQGVDDTLLMVREGAAVFSVASARTTLARLSEKEVNDAR